MPFLNFSKSTMLSLDQGWAEILGPQGINKKIQNFTFTTDNYIYFLVSLLILGLTIIILLQICLNSLILKRGPEEANIHFCFK